MEMIITKPALRETMRKLGKGKDLEIPAGLYSGNVIRNCASILGAALGRRYVVHYDRKGARYVISWTA